jgi:hypothetical protein
MECSNACSRSSRRPRVAPARDRNCRRWLRRAGREDTASTVPLSEPSLTRNDPAERGGRRSWLDQAQGTRRIGTAVLGPYVVQEFRPGRPAHKRCRRIAGAHILAADADRPVINSAGAIRGSRERDARSTPPPGRIHRRTRCRRRVPATGAPFRRSCEPSPRNWIGGPSSPA